MNALPTELTQRDKLFIGGEWRDPANGDQQTLYASHTGEAFGSVVLGSNADVNDAIAAAKAAFNDGPWGQMTAKERASVMRRFADALEKRQDQIAQITVLQNGGSLAMNQAVNAPWGVNVVRHYADMIEDMDFESPRDCANPNGTADAVIRRIPRGVCAAIVPFNISFIGGMAKLAPALAAGCTFIQKPSPETPLEAFLVAEAAQEAGIPDGVFNVVPADRDASEHLVAHPDVDMVAFTGSTAVGKQVAATRSAQMKPCALELGGNAASIVFEDMPLEAILPGLLGTSLMLNNGQACIAQSRILVPREQYETYVQALGGAASHLIVGDPFDPETHLGPLVSEQHMNRVLAQIGAGVAEGARLVSGGKRAENLPDHLKGGYFVEPTVFADVKNSMRVCQEEIFGPVIKIIPYDSEEEAIAIANDQPFGLSSSVWTADPERASRVARKIVAGNIYINGAMTIDVNVPFAGLKESGLGAECGPEGLSEYLQEQVLFTHKVA